MTTTQLPVGNPDVLIANYGGGDSGMSLPSQSAPVNEVVNAPQQPKATVTTITSVTPSPSVQGQVVTITGNVSYQ